MCAGKQIVIYVCRKTEGGLTFIEVKRKRFFVRTRKPANQNDILNKYYALIGQLWRTSSKMDEEWRIDSEMLYYKFDHR
jgi:hypothetical protein